MMRSLFKAAVCGGLLMGAVQGANAQPASRDEPIRLIVPFSAGGAVDQIARMIANNAPKDTLVIIENRGGAGGDIAVQAAARAEPNGKTVLFHTSSFVINAVLHGKGAEVEKLFDPLVRIGDVQFALVVRPTLPAHSFAEFVALAKSGKSLSYGSTGIGTTLQIAAEMLNKATGINAVHIPYRGLHPAFIDLIAGNIDFMVTSVSGILPYLKTGQMRALATFDVERSPQLPDVPSTAELGYPALAISNWYALFAGSGVPPATREQLEAMFLQILRKPVVAEFLAAAGVGKVQTGEQFGKTLREEFAQFPGLLKRLGIAENAKPK